MFLQKAIFSKATVYSTKALKLNHVSSKCPFVQIEKYFTISRNSPKKEKNTVKWSVKVRFCTKTFIAKVLITFYVRLNPNFIQVFLLSLLFRAAIPDEHGAILKTIVWYGPLAL